MCEQPVSTQPLSETLQESVRPCQSVCADMAATPGRRLLATQSGLIGSFQIGTTTGNVPQVADSLSGSALPASLNNQLGSAGEASISLRSLFKDALRLLHTEPSLRGVACDLTRCSITSHAAAMLQETQADASVPCLQAIQMCKGACRQRSRWIQQATS